MTPVIFLVTLIKQELVQIVAPKSDFRNCVVSTYVV